MAVMNIDQTYTRYGRPYEKNDGKDSLVGRNRAMTRNNRSKSKYVEKRKALIF